VHTVAVPDRERRSPLDRLVNLVPVDAIVQQVDVQQVIDRVDVNDLLDRIDWNAVVEHIDLDAIVQRSVRSATRGGHDVICAQLARLDELLTQLVNRLLRRTPADVESNSESEQRTAGSATRLIAFALDIFVAIASITLIMATVITFVDLVTGAVVDIKLAPEVSAPTTALWVLLYFFASWATVSRTPGMTVVGVRVLEADGTELTPKRAAVRTVAFPISFIGGIGLLGIVFGEHHRALHDVIARTVVTYA
jgi:uncharacterized RDD family membrane protein YckC